MDNKGKAITFMTLSSLSFAFMAVMVRFSGDLPVVEKMFFRNLVSLIIAFMGVRQLNQPIFGNKENRKWLLLRSTFGLIGVGLYFFSIDHMNLADSSILNKLSPFFVTLLAAIFLKEKIRKIQVPALIIVFSATMLIIKPQWDLSIIPALAGLGGALCAGSAYTLLRFLGNRENPAITVFFFSTFSVLILIPLLAINFVMPSWEQLAFLILIGVFAAGGQFGLTYSYKYGQAAEVSIYSYLNVVFSALMGFVFWGEVSDIWTIIGGVTIIAVAVILFYTKKND